MKRVIIIVSLSLLVLGMALFLARGLIIEQINLVRADRLSNQAQEAFEAEQWDKSARLGTAAFYLDPDNLDNQLIIARAMLKQRASGAVGWWKRVLNHPDINPDELRSVTSILVNTRRLDDGMLFLNRLLELDPDSPETQRLWLESLDIQKRLSGVMNLAERIVDEGTTDWSIHRQYLTMQQAMRGEEGGQAVLDHLRSLIDQNTSLSRVAARELASLPLATEADRLKAADYLSANATDQLDLLYAAGIRIKEGIDTIDSVEPVFLEILDSNDADLLENLLGWSVWMGQPKLVLDRLDWNRFREAGGSAEPYFEALIAAGENRRAIEISENYFNDSDDEAPIFLFYRSRAWRQLGDSEQAEGILQLAVEVVNPGNTTQLERKLFAEQQWPLLIQLYRRLLNEQPENLLFQQKIHRRKLLSGESGRPRASTGRD
jgi:hypothetical protein